MHDPVAVPLEGGAERMFDQGIYPPPGLDGVSGVRGQKLPLVLFYLLTSI